MSAATQPAPKGGASWGWVKTVIAGWELVTSVLGIISLGFAPFSCCWFYIFLGSGLGLLWIGFLPRLILGPLGRLEHLRVLLIASFPICLGCFGVLQGGKDLPDAPFFLVPPEVGWSLTIALAALLIAAPLRRALAGVFDPGTLPWSRSPAE